VTSLAVGPWARYAATEGMATAEAPVRRLVLLVDATEDTRDLYGDWFFIRGFDVVATARDDIALLIAKAYRPDLIVTDLHAKGLDGLRLAQRIRSEADTCEIPIVIMTVVTDPLLLGSLHSAGADVVSKLGDFDALERSIAALPPEPRATDRERRRRPLGRSRIV
jgi:DNA-binding response OmpR family regulator